MTNPSMSPPTTRIRVCHIDDVAAGSILKVEQNGLVLAIFNVDGEFYATDNACTHGPGELSEGELYGDVIECNFHGGQFNVRTGGGRTALSGSGQDLQSNRGRRPGVRHDLTETTAVFGSPQRAVDRA